jgi:two-component system response regulator YesN
MRVLFVDDEAIIREGLRCIIPWIEIGFDELVEATNAIEALDIIAKQPPELIITDIFMPEMSGIEFSELVREQYPSTRIIILTGYEKFEYAQEAVRIGVAQYMVKPIFPEELLTVVQEVLLDIGKERDERRWKDEAASRLERYHPIIKERFWHQLLIGNYSSMLEMEEQCSLLKIDRTSNHVFCFAIKVSADQAASRFGRNDLQLIKFAVRNIAEEIFRNLNVHFVENDSSLLFGISLQFVDEYLLHSLHLNIVRTLKIHAFIGRGNDYSELFQLALSANEAEEAAHHLFMLDESGVIRFNQLNEKKNNHVYYPYHHEKMILHELRFKDRSTPASMSAFVDALIEQSTPASVRRLMYVQLLCSIYRLADEYKLTENLMPYYDCYNELSEATTEHEALQIFNNLFQQFTQERRKLHSGSVDRLIEEAKRAIEHNFEDSSFTVGTLADLLHVSPKYLSRIFHKTAGQTCIDYLTHKRMETAKEMLANTSLRSLDIAEKVGYVNAHYFSLVFKKQTGLSPSEYRLKIQGSRL